MARRNRADCWTIRSIDPERGIAIERIARRLMAPLQRAAAKMPDPP
jgi:hypothetical protein